jgi:subtilase family serine protease
MKTGVLTLIAMATGLALVAHPTSRGPQIHAVPAIAAQPDATAGPSGITPTQLQAAYGLDTSPYAGAGQTIAIVDAFRNPNVYQDLTMFDAYWGLPVCTSTCFTEVDQNGGASYPSTAPFSWSIEIALDVEWAHAVAPDAEILLVDASSDYLSDLLTAERYAGAHATYVSNSWGFPEFSGETADATTFAEPGVSYFAAVVDSPDKTQYPATSPNVVAVGGSELTPSGTVPWTTGGGGCSIYEPAAVGEARVASLAGCSDNQSTPEVSGDAVGIPVFDAVTGWLNTGGTSFATVLWTAAAADSGQLVTTAAIASGSIPLRPVVGGTLLRTGIGDLGPIPHAGRAFVNMASAKIDSALAQIESAA